ncbi:hypothetical protein TNCV_3618791 [Trichonephila clavipes]|nr:hypothetical protein TNCV_3618791 [Trichonephila clavipes]
MHVEYVESFKLLALVWYGILERWLPAQVSSSSFDHGSKFRSPLPKALDSFVNPTPLAHADTQSVRHPSGGLSQYDISKTASIMHIWLPWHLQATDQPTFVANTYLLLYGAKK